MVPDVCFDQVAPPLAVARTMPSSPIAQPCSASVKSTALNDDEVPLVWDVQPPAWATAGRSERHGKAGEREDEDDPEADTGVPEHDRTAAVWCERRQDGPPPSRATAGAARILAPGPCPAA